MDMTPIQWILIVLLVLLIAVGVYMLTRKPASRQDRNEEDGQISTTYGAGGEHVAAGDAGATPSAPLYDQEADAAVGQSSVEDDPIEAPVWNGDDDAVGQDTATGGDIEIVEEEPVVSATEDVEPIHEPAHASDFADTGDREQMSYGDPQAEDFASETVYAEAPVEDYSPDTSVDSSDIENVPDAIVVEDSDDVPHDAAAAGFMGATGATAMGSRSTSGDESTTDTGHDVDAHDHPVTENPGPENASDEWPQGRPEQGHPGGHSQPGDEATYAAPATDGEGSENPGPDEGEGGADDESDLGHPGANSQQSNEATYVVGDAGAMADAGAANDDNEDSDESAFEPSHVDESPAEPAEIEIVEPEVAFADSPPSDEVIVEEVVFEDPIEGEPVTTDGSPSEAVMVDVNDYDTHESVQPDQHNDEHHYGEHHDSEEHQGEEDAHTPVPVDEEGHTSEVVEDTDEAPAANDQPQAVMVDVDDYGTHESVQPDHHNDEHQDSGEHQDNEEHDSEQHQAEEDTHAPVAVEEEHTSEFVEHPASQDVAHDESAAEDTAYVPVDAEDDQPVEEPAEEPNPLIEDSPYGAGSAIPGDDGQGPDGYEIKGNAGSMLFHTPESPSYEECTPEVFFENEDAARAAGFAHWDRKRR